MGYGQAADGLRSRFSPNAPHLFYVYEWDPQGSLVQRQTSGTSGNELTYALDTALYDGYGARLQDTDAPGGGPEAARDSMGFQGQWGAYTDNETGLVLMGHRYYDAGTGRFLTRDPIGYNGGINLYGFTGNNPVNESDPDGTNFGDYLKGIGDAVNPFEAAKGIVSLGKYLASGHANAKALGKAVLTGLNPVDANATDRQSGQRAMGDGLLLLGGYGALSKLRALGDAGEVAASFEEGMSAEDAQRYSEFQSQYAPKRITPGSGATRLKWTRVSGRTGRVEKSVVVYDKFGRQKYRVELTDHLRPARHTNPHLHETFYDYKKYSGDGITKDYDLHP